MLVVLQRMSSSPPTSWTLTSGHSSFVTAGETDCPINRTPIQFGTRPKPGDSNPGDRPEAWKQSRRSCLDRDDLWTPLDHDTADCQLSPPQKKSSRERTPNVHYSRHGPPLDHRPTPAGLDPGRGDDSPDRGDPVSYTHLR